MSQQKQGQEEKQDFSFLNWLRKTQKLNDSKDIDIHQRPFQYVGQKLLSAFISVVISEYLVSNTVIYRLINKLNLKKLKDQAQKKQWISQQLNRITKTMIRYNTIVFGSKVILDEYYQETLKKNQHYYQSNSITHYKIGAMVGAIAYATNIPIAEFQYIKTSLKKQVNSPRNINYFSRLNATFLQFLTIDALRRMLNSISLASLGGVIIYRMIYFGGYQKIKNRYKHPLSEYLLAPIICSSLSMIVSPLDQVKYLQLTSHKDKSFFDILSQKGVKLLNLSGQRIFSSIIKQAVSMVAFVSGQKICKQLIKMKQDQ